MHYICSCTPYSDKYETQNITIQSRLLLSIMFIAYSKLRFLKNDISTVIYNCTLINDSQLAAYG